MSMITGLDHIAVGVDDVASAIAGYEAVLGRMAEGNRVQLANTALGVAAHDAERPLLGLAFGVGDKAESARRLSRRGLPGKPATDGRIEIDRHATHQVAIDLVERSGSLSPAPAQGGASDIIGLDHVVVRTGDPERAVALYGGRLGLDLRLDRTNPERHNRLLFFVCGDLVVEVSHDTRRGVVAGPDSIWGLAWRSADLDASHARMAAVGVAVSEIRTGNRPGPRVFTVKSHTAQVPTLVIGGHGLVRA